MVNNPLISVIIPVYKVEKYLNKCIDSVLNQTYDNLEIILVDDGSPDNCGRICDEYAQKDSLIKVIHQENAGLPAARNAGIDVATGEYITFVDSDDYIHPEMVEILYSNLVLTDVDISVCGFISFNEGEEPEVKKRKTNELVVLTRDDIPLIPQLSPYISLASACCKLYKAILFEKIRFDSRLIKVEDLDFSLRMYVNIDKMCFDVQPMYYYLLRKDSIIHERGYPIEYAIQAYNNVIDYYKSIDANEELLKFVVNHKINTISDMYYLACIHNSPKNDRRNLKQAFNIDKKVISQYNLWTIKLRLFDICPPVFVLAMKIYIKLRNTENEQLK